MLHVKIVTMRQELLTSFRDEENRFTKVQAVGLMSTASA